MPSHNVNQSRRLEPGPAADRWQVGVVVAVLVMALAWIFVYATVMNDSAPARPDDHVRYSKPVNSSSPNDVQSSVGSEAELRVQA